MFAKIKQVAAVGAAVAGVGWVTVVSPAVAHTQPLPIPQGFTCPDIAGVQYLRDPDNSNAYYVCVDGQQQDHKRCPAVTPQVTITPTPPTRCPATHQHPPCHRQ